MVEKFKLNLIVGFTILLVTVWLIWSHRVWDWTGNLLLLGAMVLIVWTLLVREKKPAKLLEFFIKSLIISYAVIGIIWFINLTVTAPWYYSYLNSESLMNILIFNILPLALLPVAISVIIYGMFRVKLRSWEIFLSGWYMFIFAVQAAYSVWWTLFIQPYQHHYYQSGAGATALDMLLALLAFLMAGVFTIAYVAIIGPKETEG